MPASIAELGDQPEDGLFDRHVSPHRLERITVSGEPAAA